MLKSRKLIKYLKCPISMIRDEPFKIKAANLNLIPVAFGHFCWAINKWSLPKGLFRDYPSLGSCILVVARFLILSVGAFWIFGRHWWTALVVRRVRWFFDSNGRSFWASSGDHLEGSDQRNARFQGWFAACFAPHSFN